MPHLHANIRPRTLLVVAAAVLAAVFVSSDSRGGTGLGPSTEVVVTLQQPSLSMAVRRPLAATPSSRAALAHIDAEQAVVSDRIVSTVPGATIRWRYRLVENGLAVVLPQKEIALLQTLPGVAKVWPNLRYHDLAVKGSPQQIGADKLWGGTLENSGQGVKIAIIDDGLDPTHPYFAPKGLRYPPGFPKGQKKYTTPKVIVQRAFAPVGATNKYANVPFDPDNSWHATHVAGIAAGDYATNAKGTLISGVAPNAYLGNYKALSTPTPGFGLDGNSAELTAAIEAAVSDGMNVINMSLGEPEVEPSRDIVVQALEHAAAAGVVPVIAAGNDFDEFGYGSIDSPANTPDAIAVAAVDSKNQIADFSSAGPTPVSLQMKPDVAAPGVGVLSSVPGAKWESVDGTSMASPAVAGAVALLKQHHPDWTVAELKSALVQTGAPVGGPSGGEALATREGGGVVDLAKADDPLVFAAPTSLSFGRLGPGASAQHTVTLTDAGGGAGAWDVATDLQSGNGAVSTPATVTVPGTLTVTATGGTNLGDDIGFLILSRGTDVRRIPFWFLTSAPKLASERALPLTKPGLHAGTTAGGQSLVSTYRYPTGGDLRYPGPERVYRVRITGKPANFGVVVLKGAATPHITFYGSEDHLAGYTALPVDFNPYRQSYGLPRKVSGVVLPAHGVYDVVFDTRTATPTPFTFRFWVNDVTPPRLRVSSTKGEIVVAAVDRGSGVDPSSIVTRLDGKAVTATYHDGRVHIPAQAGLHTFSLTVSDYQETKNMEDVPPVLPNTATLTKSVVVR
jgi:subtilisin family serine protease